MDNVIAFIPGISLSNEGHSFIQVLNGINGKTHYFSFPLVDFEYRIEAFDVSIGDNQFSTDGFKVDLRQGKDRIKGEVEAILKRSSKTVFEGKGRRVGLEIMGEVEDLFRS